MSNTLVIGKEYNLYKSMTSPVPVATDNPWNPDLGPVAKLRKGRDLVRKKAYTQAIAWFRAIVADARRDALEGLPWRDDWALALQVAEEAILKFGPLAEEQAREEWLQAKFADAARLFVGRRAKIAGLADHLFPIPAGTLA